MNRQQFQSQCNSEKLELYLRGTLSSSEADILVLHLSECEACARQIQLNAEQDVSWREVQSMLSSDEFDTPQGTSSSSSYLSGEHDSMTKHQTADVLSREIRGWLDPTDDSRSMGRFAGYEIIGIVGHGGMGIVLKGFEGSLNRYVAIKILAPRLATNGSARRRFSREAQAAAAVRHDNVIAIHRVDDWHGLPFLVMPYAGGTSLQKRIDSEGPLSIEQSLRVGVQIASGLAAAHAQGLIHRDIKPANILLEQGVERVTITDFGLARAADDASVTRTGVIAGTPQYMSPEQAEAKQLDARSDLFSLGSVLYAMATGRAPFRGEGSFEVLNQVVNKSARPMREIESSVPEWFEKIVNRLLSKSPNDRPNSALGVAELLQKCLAHIQQPSTTPLPEFVRFFPRSRFFHRFNFRTGVYVMLAVTSSILFVTLIIPAIGEPKDEAQTALLQERGDDKNPAPDLPPEGLTATGRAEIDGYLLSVVGMRDVSGLQMSPQFDLSRMSIQQPNFQQFGQTTTNGSVSGGGGGAGGGFGQSFTKPNFGIAMQVKPLNSHDNTFIELGTKISVLEIDGSVSESPTLGPVINRFIEFERKYPGTLTAYLYRENNKPPTQVMGEFRVVPGRRVEVQFDGTKKQSKPVGNEKITLESVKSNTEGIQVSLRFPMLTAIRNARNPQERFQAIVATRSAYSAMIEDSSGGLHAPTSGTDSGSDVQTSFSFSNVNGVQSVQGKAGSPENPSQKFTFKPLPNGITVRTIVVSFTDRQGEPTILPFSVPLNSEPKNLK